MYIQLLSFDVGQDIFVSNAPEVSIGSYKALKY